MAKIIVSSRYVRNTPKRSAANLVRYMGTREGVEKVPVGIEDGPATVRQQRLIKDLLETDADAKNTFEYQDYENNPTKQNATEFIDAFIERNADRVDEMDKLVKYMAERPSVEKLGPHGLFNQYDDKIDLDSVAEEVGQHQGIVWTHVVSLHREDAERLGYNKAEVWKDLVRRNMMELAKAHKIDLDQLQWYAAFHNTTHHPHIHLLVYARDARQGWLSKQGIDELRNVFGNDIFRFEQQKLFRMETELRDKLKDEVEEDLFQKVVDARNSYAPTPEVVLLFRKLASQLKKQSGKKVYAYLPKEAKQTVDQIVAELAKSEGISGLYKEWKLRAIEIQKFYNQLRTSGRLREAQKEKNPGLSPSYIRGIHTMLHTCLQAAVREKLLQYNPVDDCKPPKLVKKEMKTLEPEQVQAYLKAAEARGLLPMFFLELTTGMRKSELVALLWSDVDWKEQTISVSKQAYVTDGKLTAVPPKTANSIRKIALSQETLDLLRKQKIAFPDSDCIFPSPVTGEMYHPDSVVNLHKKILKEAGLEHIRFHDLRHTFATLALQNGVDVKTVSAMLGHSNAGFTLATYTHTTTAAQHQAAAIMGSLVSMGIAPEQNNPAQNT